MATKTCNNSRRKSRASERNTPTKSAILLPTNPTYAQRATSMAMNSEALTRPNQCNSSETAPQNSPSGETTTDHFIPNNKFRYHNYQFVGSFIASSCLMIYLKFGLLDGVASQHSFMSLANCSGVFLGMVGRSWLARTCWETSWPFTSTLFGSYFCMGVIWRRSTRG